MQWTISALLFSYCFVMSKQNSIYSVIESIWAYFCMHSRFSVCFPVRIYFASLQGVYYFLLLTLLSNGFMPKTLQTTLILYTAYWSPHTSIPVLLIVTSCGYCWLPTLISCCIRRKYHRQGKFCVETVLSYLAYL